MEMLNLLTTDNQTETLPEKQSLEDIRKKRNDFIILKVKLWQNFQYVRPLLCRNCGLKLVPKVHKRSGKVCLRCTKCNFLQWSIPNVVLQSKLVIYDHAKQIKRKFKVNKKKSNK